MRVGDVMHGGKPAIATRAAMAAPAAIAAIAATATPAGGGITAGPACAGALRA
jgi:hypothetical protein